MTDQGRPRSARLSAYATASSHLALLSDLALQRVVDQAPRVTPGMGGTSVTVEVEGVRVFVKQVPVTGRELLPGNVRSTANLFGLPDFYQYGLGSAGFGAWRELAAHIMTTSPHRNSLTCARAAVQARGLGYPEGGDHDHEDFWSP